MLAFDGELAVGDGSSLAIFSAVVALGSTTIDSGRLPLFGVGCCLLIGLLLSLLSTAEFDDELAEEPFGECTL